MLGIDVNSKRESQRSHRQLQDIPESLDVTFEGCLFEVSGACGDIVRFGRALTSHALPFFRETD